MFSHKNILLVGGCGFIGSHLADEICQYEFNKLIIVDNLSLGKLENVAHIKEKEGIELLVEDASNYYLLKEVLENNSIDVVFNLAVIPLPSSLIEPRKNIFENIQIVNNLCDLQRDGKFVTLIHCSSSEVYGTAQFVPMSEEHKYGISTPYAASKAAGDLVALSYAKTYNTDVIIVRPFNNYGPRQNEGAFAGIIPLSINKILCDQEIEIHGDGKQTRDYIYVKDTVKAILEIYQSGNTEYDVVNIASGKEINVLRIIDHLYNVLGKDVRRIRHVEQRPANALRHKGDISILKHVFQFVPFTSFEDGIKETVDWYLKKREG